ncbi:MAG: capsular biosynthesis protein [Pannonibacter sp.]
MRGDLVALAKSRTGPLAACVLDPDCAGRRSGLRLIAVGLDPAAFIRARTEALATGARLALAFPGPFGIEPVSQFPHVLGLLVLPPRVVLLSEQPQTAFLAALRALAPADHGAALAAWRSAWPDPWYRHGPLELPGPNRFKLELRQLQADLPPDDGEFRLVASGNGAFAPCSDTSARLLRAAPQPGSPQPWLAAATRLETDSAAMALYALLSGIPLSEAPDGSVAALLSAAPDRDALTGVLAAEGLAWIEPYRRQAVSLAEGLDIAATLASVHQQNAQAAFCLGAQSWNHAAIRATFTGAGGGVTFCSSQGAALEGAQKTGGCIISWAGKTSAELEVAAEAAGVPLLRIEDGFLRSVGLGAGLARGASLAVDDLGIYYDPSRPSALEHLLMTAVVTWAQKARGAALRHAIVAARITKYNFGERRRYDFPKDRQVVLVPGQVADDAAVRRSTSATIDCANTPNVNLDLLRLARLRNPDAYLVFKPHPDVETGLRKGKIDEADLAGLADFVARDADIVDLIEAADKVETFSSLSGFEAMLRGKAVTTHGLPFYAGWGLSEDLTTCERRGRARDIDELVYLALVVYTRCIDPVTLLPCRPEDVIARLVEQRQSRRHRLAADFWRHLSWLGRRLGL